MRVAVIGGGIFGCTTAIHLAKAGHSVTLFEREADLMLCASRANQYRLHRGYHYPRSSETVFSIIEAEIQFRKEYMPSVIDGLPTIYGIAKTGSLTSADEYIRFCDAHKLPYRVTDASQYLATYMLDVVIEATESHYDVDILVALVRQSLNKCGVEIQLSTEPTAHVLDSYDQIVIATYADLNTVDLPELVAATNFQFEVCEKPVVRMPNTFPIRGVVIMDGPFMCIDPYGRSDLFILGNVVHAIHATNIGLKPDVPIALLPYLNKGLINKPLGTKWQHFIESGTAYIPALRAAEHVGSFFTIRTVLPKIENTDARPTIVNRVSDRCIQIFSGKVANCVRAAHQVTALVQTRAMANAEAHFP